MKILCKVTGKNGYPYDTGKHEYSRFKLEMPSPKEHDMPWLKDVHKSAVSLTRQQLKRLKRLYWFINIFRFAYFPINYKILPTFYDLGLFTGSGHFWCEAYKWLLLKDRHKFDDLSLDLTLVLLTASLAGSDDGLGADLWYEIGITRRLLRHLIKLVEEEKNMINNLDNHPMSYDLHKKVTAEEKAAALQHARELKKKLDLAAKKAEEDYESSKRK